MYATIVRRPSAFLPVAMSLVALGVIAAHIAIATSVARLALAQQS